LTKILLLELKKLILQGMFGVKRLNDETLINSEVPFELEEGDLQRA